MKITLQSNNWQAHDDDIETLVDFYRDWRNLRERLTELERSEADIYTAGDPAKIDALLSQFRQVTDELQLYSDFDFSLVADEAELREHPDKAWRRDDEAAIDNVPDCWISGEPLEKLMDILCSDAEPKKPQLSCEQRAEAGDFGFAMDRGEITNERVTAEKDSNGNPIAEPLTLQQIRARIASRFGGFPASCNGELFIPNGRNGCDFFATHDELFAWLANFGHVTWNTSIKKGFVTQKQVFADFRRSPKRKYDAVENQPHYPPMPDTFYTCGNVSRSGDGSRLEKLLDCFCPATTRDRQLIKAMFATAFWGGAYGHRPAFLITAEKGRGVGKSKLAEMVGHLAGGHFEFSAAEDEQVIKQRLLTPTALTTRAALLDNVKSNKFSWSVLESLITSPTISGKQMYTGEYRRPNNLLWLITLNGASLSTDLAQRVVAIEIDRPHYRASWYEDTRSFIVANRWAIIADIITLLRDTPAKPLPHLGRWASWVGSVLARLDEPAELLDLIESRQGTSDVENEEASLVEDFFEQQLRKLGYEPLTDRIFIPTKLAAEWMSLATRENVKTNPAGRQLNQWIGEESIKRIERSKDNKRARGFVWSGESTGNHTWGDVERRIAEQRERANDSNVRRLLTAIGDSRDNTGTARGQDEF